MLNSAVIMGRLTANPELKTTENGVNVLRFTVAVERAIKDKNGNKQTDFINVVAWRQTAEFVARYFKKGDMIAVKGQIQTRQYDDRNGNKRTAVEIVTGEVSFCGYKNDNTSESVKQSDNNSSIKIEYDEDELPF